jgi:hypothetical protein
MRCDVDVDACCVLCDVGGSTQPVSAEHHSGFALLICSWGDWGCQAGKTRITPYAYL